MVYSQHLQKRTIEQFNVNNFSGSGFVAVDGSLVEVNRMLPILDSGVVDFI